MLAHRPFFVPSCVVILNLLLVSPVLSQDARTDSQHATVRPMLANGPFTVRAVNEPPVEKWLHEILEQPIPELKFPGPTPLDEILSVLEAHYKSSHKKLSGAQHSPPHVFYPDHGELALEQIDSLGDVMISDINFAGMKLRNALKLILDQTSDDTKSPVPLDFVVINEVILITSRIKAEEGWPITRGYRVGELCRAIRDADIDGIGAATAGELPKVLMELTPELRWTAKDHHGGGTVLLVGRTLVVHQTAKGHERIVSLLNMLAASEASEKPVPVSSPGPLAAN